MHRPDLLDCLVADTLYLQVKLRGGRFDVGFACAHHPLNQAPLPAASGSDVQHVAGAHCPHRGHPLEPSA
jgi:hypothetical protein